MRRLARSLVADPERADELSQETWKRILEHPPRLDRPFRGWIATVMRNLLRAEHRGAQRRATRERAGAREEAQPSSLELLERATLQRELVQAVLVLEEPYRTTILLRYFEDLTPQEIAARERVPLPTVKTRLARGIAKLREALGRTHGPDGRTSVLAALIRIETLPRSAPWIPWTAASLLMNAKLALPLALLLAGLALFLFTRHESPAPLASAALAEAPTETRASAPTGFAEPASTEARREPAPVRATSRGTEPARPSALPLRVLGQVIDATGRPVGGVEIGLSRGDSPAPATAASEARAARALTRAAASGRFELEGAGEGRLCVLDPGWATILAGIQVDARSGQESRIVVAPSLSLGGIVLDEFGVPLAGAVLTAVPPRDLRTRLEHVLDFSAAVPFETTSDERGRFRLEAAAFLDGRLRITLGGFESHEEELPTVSRNDLVLVLHRPEANRSRLRGLVVDPGGQPVAEARVAYGLDTTLTDERGNFAFELDDPEALNRRLAGRLDVPDDRLRALKAGYLPGELRALERTADGRPSWPSPLVLRLGGTPPTIAGRVLDERGEPLPARRVWISDPTFFGGVRVDPGAERPAFLHVETLLSGGDEAWTWTETDADGAFELGGLMEHDYEVSAMDPATLQRTHQAGIAAGRRDVVLVLPTNDLFPRLAGRVVDGRGRPVANAQVFPMCDALVTRFEGATFSTHHETAPGTQTDDEGRFLLERVPEDLVYLRIQGPDTLPVEWGRGLEGGLARLAGEHPEELLIEIERRCHFQVELRVPDEADELGMLDDDGNELVISDFLGNGRRDTERHALLEGRSSTLAVGDRAGWLVLYRAGVEVRRVPVRLEPGSIATLRE